MNGTSPIADPDATAERPDVRPRVAVIICTRNRADSLRETLASLAHCVVPPDLDAELLIVDNGSTDATARVVREARLENLPTRLVHEPQPGLSRARNAALNATRADVLLFTDDDVRPPRDWIAGMCQPILSGEADAVAGGVHFPPEYEPMLAREPFRFRRGWLASTGGLDPENPDIMVGANMAFSRRVADALGGFDHELGAGALGFGEESLFSARALAAGFRIKGALDVSVAHHFDLARLNVSALIKMAQRMGQSTAYLDYHWEQADACAAGSRIHQARLLLAWERLLRPWRAISGRQPWQTTQRVMTLAYWRQLASYEGQPRRYERNGSVH